jgi:hypothetical protein
MAKHFNFLCLIVLKILCKYLYCVIYFHSFVDFCYVNTLFSSFYKIGIKFLTIAELVLKS